MHINSWIHFIHKKPFFPPINIPTVPSQKVLFLSKTNKVNDVPSSAILMIPQTQKSSRKFFKSKLQKLFFFFFWDIVTFKLFPQLFLLDFFWVDVAASCKLEELGTVLSFWRQFRGFRREPKLTGGTSPSEAEDPANTLAPVLISVRELLIILHEEGEMLDHNHFSLLDTSMNPSSSIFLRLAALQCFPLSLFQGTGSFALSRGSRPISLQELPAGSGWGCWCLPPSWDVFVPSPVWGMPFYMRCWSHQQLSFPFLHHQMLSGDQLNKLEEENSIANSFLQPGQQTL